LSNSNIKIDEIIERLILFEDSFQKYSLKEEISCANYNGITKINKMLFELKLSNNIDVSMIKEIVQNVENQEHCDGVSWLDYKMHIRTFLKFYGVEFVF
jgi:hypothetical protein